MERVTIIHSAFCSEWHTDGLANVVDDVRSLKFVFVKSIKSNRPQSGVTGLLVLHGKGLEARGQALKALHRGASTAHS